MLIISKAASYQKRKDFQRSYQKIKWSTMQTEKKQDSR